MLQVLLLFLTLSLVINCSTTNTIVQNYKNIAYYRTLANTKNTPENLFLKNKLKAVTGQKLCLISNQAGLASLAFIKSDENRYPSKLHQVFANVNKKLVAIFTPEHGLSAQATSHGNLAHKKPFRVDSLYFLKTKAIKLLLKDCDSIIYSLPDAGVRPFTYRTILTRSLSAFSQLKKMKANKSEYWVIDQPNPASYLHAHSPMIEKFSYLGEEKIPFFPHYTYGEMAKHYAKTIKSNINLKIFKLRNYKPKKHFLQSNYRYRQPSPNLPTFRSLQCYWSSVFLEGIEFDLGRNSNDPFCLIGHKDISFENAMPKIRGVSWQSYSYVPWGGLFKGKLIKAYRMRVTNPEVYNPVQTSFYILAYLKKTYPNFFKFKRSKKDKSYWLDKLTGSSRMRLAIENRQNYASWLEAEKKLVKKYKLSMRPFRLY